MATDLDRGSGPNLRVSPVTATLRDGTRVRVRAMHANDRARLLRFHSRLSNETTHLRFFSVHPRLSVNELDRFTHVDHDRREAIVATAEGEIVGVARFERIADTAEAEVAFVVDDAWQGRGLGTVLFARLAIRAKELGIERFVADTLPHNQRMRAVFRDCGRPSRSEMADGVVRVWVDLP